MSRLGLPHNGGTGTGPGERYTASRSAIRTVIKVVRRSPDLWLGLVIVIAFCLAALLAPWLAPYSATRGDFTDVLSAPNAKHLFGTDALGRDTFSRVLYGARPSIVVGAGVALLAGLLGTIVGLISGFYGGWVDSLLMRCMDVLFAFPAILLALALVVVLGPKLQNVVIALAVVYAPRFARITRGEALSVRTEVFIEAATALGSSATRVVLRHLLPNLATAILVQATVTVAYAILSEAGLSFLGLGIQPPQPSWGGLLSEGRTYLEQHPHLTVFPGLAIALVVLGFNLLGGGLRRSVGSRG